MITHVNGLQVDDVKVVGESYSHLVEDEDVVATPPALLLEGRWQDQVLKGLQVGGHVFWFQPWEYPGLVKHFGGEQ